MNKFIKSHFSGCRFLPVLHGVGVLTFQERFVYSLMLRYGRRGKGVSKYQIARITAFHHLTVTKIIKSLTEKGLATKVGVMQVPLEPWQGLFRKKRKQIDKEGNPLHWTRAYSSGCYLYRSRSSPLTWLQTAIYSQIIIINEVKYRLTINGIAKLLGVSKLTVQTAMKKLRQVKLLDSKNNLLEPLEEQTAWFVQDWKKQSDQDRAAVKRMEAKIENQLAYKSMDQWEQERLQAKAEGEKRSAWLRAIPVDSPERYKGYYEYLTGEKIYNMWKEHYGEAKFNTILEKLYNEADKSRHITPAFFNLNKQAIKKYCESVDTINRDEGDTTNGNNNGNQFSSKRFLDATPLARVGVEQLEEDEFLARLDAE